MEELVEAINTNIKPTLDTPTEETASAPATPNRTQPHYATDDECITTSTESDGNFETWTLVTDKKLNVNGREERVEELHDDDKNHQQEE